MDCKLLNLLLSNQTV